MQENDYDCDVRPLWNLAYWLFIALFLFNGFFYFCGTSIWHTIGITMGFQMIVYYPLWKNWPPSCLSYFLVDLKLSLGLYLTGPLIDLLDSNYYSSSISYLMRLTQFWNDATPDGSANY